MSDNNFYGFDPNDNKEHEYRPSSVTYTPPLTQSYTYASQKPKKTRGRAGFGALIVSLAFVFSVGGTMLGNYLVPKQDIAASPSSKQEQKTESKSEVKKETDAGIIKTSVNLATGEMTTQQVAEKTADSIVEITTEMLTTGNRMQQYVSTGAGSGVIISADGYIVTNNHVIADATKITVTLRDGTQYSAKLVGTDKQTDIAVIKADATGLPLATFGTSETLKVGQTAIAIGNPLGQLGGTVTDGIISALNREITIDGEVMNLMQTNAAINPGNSGGGLFNNKGELIGIVNAKSSGTGVEGLGFAIPVDIAKPVIEDLIKYGYVQGRVELGMQMIDIEDPLTAMMYSVNHTGVYVLSVAENSSAAKAGLQPGDRITSFDGQEITVSTDVTALVSKHAVGDSIEVKIVRGNKTGKATITLQEQKSGLEA